MNSTILRTASSSTPIYIINATKSPVVILPFLSSNDPTRITTMYIKPSKVRVTLRNPAIALYPMAFTPRNLELSTSNLACSNSSFANDFETFIPSRLSSTCELISPRPLRCILKARLIFFLKVYVAAIMIGIIANISTVSRTSILTKSTKPRMIFIDAIQYSSGQWCANSVISNKSLVILDIS